MENTENQDIRPPVDTSMTAEAFERWYWPVDLLKAFCEALDIPASGSKSELRARVAFALSHPGQPIPKPTRKSSKGSFNWSKSALSLDTVITENVSFGPNVRGFFKREIGKQFVCHSDFMAWMRHNSGATLEDAVHAWWMLERRKEDPEFRREIAECNNYLQYLRDARDTMPTLTLDDAKTCWDYKKVRPAQDGKVIFEREDVENAGIIGRSSNREQEA